MKTLISKALTSVAAVAMMGAPAALAQATPAQQAAPQQAAPVTDTEVTQFVAANAKVGTIAADINSGLSGEETEAELAELQQSAQTKMIAAIEEEGLTAGRYTEIMQLAQTDPEVNARVVSEMDG
ncbi:DUF4168 domain-containing protein [Henriciella pelagia]|uniref:DUF4168 domain-containing protein n=1 Tax=Henriciella pelagia TaxID=1977912 RepID=A0ABQ1JQF9_9PROT|nr:DUF4168 domain-containing protein [Henriciella pelagia]GGB75010.1 hypothetical protein GCM10011503_24620 [Henriciella pelagia]